MQLPGIARGALEEGEEVATSVPLGGDDRLFVTPRRSLVYRSGGVLSDESVESLGHDVTRLTVSEGRRKATLGLEYAVDENRDLAVPLDRLEKVLQPLLAAVLRAGDVTDPGERVHRVFSFSELTLVVTDERLLKHVGAVLWDDDHESIPFESVTDLDYEEGSVATGVVFTVDGRKERLKTPNDRLPEVREHLESALLAAHDVDSVAGLDRGDAGEDAAGSESGGDPGSAVADFGGVDALDAGPGGDDRPATTRPEDRTAGDSVRAGGDAVGAGGRAATDDAGTAAESAPAGPSSDAATGDGGTTVADAGDDSPAAGTGDTQTAAAETDADDTDGPTHDAGDDGPAAESDSETPFTEPVEPAEPDAAVQEELSELRRAVERQNELLQRHNEAVERLVETLREN